MSVLAILLPPRERLSARAAESSFAAGMSGLRLPTDWTYAYSVDGRSVAQAGSAAAALLPRADHSVLAAPALTVGRLATPRWPQYASTFSFHQVREQRAAGPSEL